MVKNIRHTGIVVKNLEKSLAFYRDLLGFKVERQMEEKGGYIDKVLALEGVSVTTVKMKAPDGEMIELLEYHSHLQEIEVDQITDIGIRHVAFTVDNLDSEYQRLKDAGIFFNSRPEVSPDGYAKVAFCRAPEGTFIELVEVL
ncbi:MAG: VOC family protein [Candidatus Omnitrophica bacterium]|nr:VOC family protein [Candidatus Omnitrophota bacterium]MBU2266237.1 VOC family protein [Candidatus Omnitrophota bacterium]